MSFIGVSLILIARIVVALGTNYRSKALVKDSIFYSVAASVIALIAQLAGASLPVILFLSLLIPPIFLLIIRIVR